MQASNLARIWPAIRTHRSLAVSTVVLGGSAWYTLSLAVIHHTGAELYGVLTAALSTVAAATTIALLRSPQTRVIATGLVIAMWVVVALGGIAGVIAHVVGPVPGHGPIDLRPRPIAAPLVFTLLGSLGGAALVTGQRARARSATKSGQE